jgi:integrase
MRNTKLNKLTQLQVKNAPLKGPPLSDGGGLYVRERRYVFRFTSPLDGREHDISLGPITGLTLAQARQKAAAYRNLLAQKIDPRQFEAGQREAKKAAEARNITFGEVTAKYLDAKLSDRKTTRNQNAVRAALDNHTKALANVPIANINSMIIASALKPLADRPAARENVIGLIHSVFSYGMAADIIPEGLNPARRAKLGKLLPERKTPVRHNRFLPLPHLSSFMALPRNTSGNLARAVELTIHTGLRQNEVIGLRWDWVDTKDRSITIPASAMKAAKAHRVFLSDHAHGIIMSMLPQRRANGFVFPGGSAAGSIGIHSLRTFLSTKFPELKDYQLHGARASLKTWATAHTTHRREIIEATLAHAIGGSVESSYFAVDAPEVREARQRLYDDWSRFLTGTTPVEEAENVLPFAPVKTTTG